MMPSCSPILRRQFSQILDGDSSVVVAKGRATVKPEAVVSLKLVLER